MGGRGVGREGGKAGKMRFRNFFEVKKAREGTSLRTEGGR